MMDARQVVEEKDMPFLTHIRSVVVASAFVAAARATHAGAPAAGEPVTFAVIGDYGGDNTNEAAVADLIKNVLQPQFIVTVGDNNYGSHSATGYDAAVGKYYSQYIGNYTGQYGPGSPVNRFWPALGNHDWSDNTGFQAYLAYFTLPGNERTYELVAGPVHLFFINSDSHEAAGNTSNSAQAQWLQNAMTSSRAAWKLVVLHHAPYSSGSEHGSNTTLQWPYRDWGADAVLAGHDHDYERHDVGGIPYFVSGLGGRSIYSLNAPLAQSRFRYNANYGAMLVIADQDQITYEFWSVAGSGTLIDRQTVPKVSPGPAIIPAGSAWKYLDNGSNQGADWREPGFDDASWLTGLAQFGYGEGDEATVVSFGPNANNKFVTTYFRHCFEIFDPSVAPSLTLGLLRDDGAIAYLNGVEIARTNLPFAPAGVNHLTLATTGVGGASEGTWQEIAIHPCLLEPGPNVIAVEIHQSSPTTSDLSFDLSLRPSSSAPPLCLDPCPGDLNDSDVVDIDDLLSVVHLWGVTGTPAAPADADNNGVVNIDDLLAVIGSWGACL